MYRGRPYLVRGTAGAGKTVPGFHFLVAGVAADEDVVGVPVADVFGHRHAEALANQVTRPLADGEREGWVETTVAFPDATTWRLHTRIAVKPLEEAYRSYACVSHDVMENEPRGTVVELRFPLAAE